jgi:hypothetical protein
MRRPSGRIPEALKTPLPITRMEPSELAPMLFERFALLLEKYGIPPEDSDAFERLVWALALEHEPGFQLHDVSCRSALSAGSRNRGGRPPEIEDKVGTFGLILDEALRVKNLRGACRLVRRKFKRLRKYSTDQLESFYYRSRNDMEGEPYFFDMSLEQHCKHAPENSCFCSADLDNCKMSEVPNLCQSPKGCTFAERLAPDIAAYQPSPPVEIMDGLHNIIMRSALKKLHAKLVNPKEIKSKIRKLS